MRFNAYPFVMDAALYVDEDLKRYLAEAVFANNDDVSVEEYLEDSGNVDFSDDFPEVETTYEFSGEIEQLQDSASHPLALPDSFDADSILYVYADKANSLYESYADIAELVNEFKTKLAYAKDTIPDDFDWESHIVRINGVVWEY